MPKLVIQDGEGTREVGLENEHIVGRLPACDVQLDSKDISRRHCRFLEEGSSWFVEDLGSTFGTLVNGRKVTKFELQDGDEVSLGTFTLRFLDTEPAVEDALDDGWGDDDEISLDERYFLVLGGGGRSGEVIDLPEGSTRLGRGAQAVLQIRDASVSGAHADLVREGDRLTVRDLGSSNGTFLEEERVEEAEVSSGQVLTFGAVPAVYGVGDPKDFAAPVPVAPALTAAAAPAAGAEGDAFIDEGDFLTSGAAGAPKSSTGKVLMLAGLALVVIGGAAGGAYFFMSSGPGGGLSGGVSGPRPPAYEGDNIVPSKLWSFEPLLDAEDGDGEILGEGGAPTRWMQFGDPGLIVVEEAGLVRSGDSSLRLSYAVREGQAQPRRLVAAAFARRGQELQSFSVPSTKALQLSLYVSGADATARPAALVRWLNSDDELVGQDFVRAQSDSADGEWREIRGVCVRPSGAVSALVGPALLGVGEAVFDDLSAKPTELPAGRSVEIESCRLSLLAGGQLRLSRVGRVLIEGLSPLWEGGQSGLRERQPASAGAGPIVVAVGEGQSLTSELAVDGTVLTASLAGEGLAGASHLQLDLPGSSEGAPVVSLLTEGRGERMFRGFETREADALIVGRGTRICSLAFVDGSGQPLPLAISGEVVGDVLRLRAAWTGADALGIRVQTDFREANSSARELVRSARAARRGGRLGEALSQAREVLGRFPFNDQSLGEANAIVRELEGEARTLESSLKEQLDDAVFFKRLARSDDIASGLAAAVTAWKGSTAVAPFEGLQERFVALVADDQKARPAEHAQRMLERAAGYRADEDHDLANTVLRGLIASYPLTPAAEVAKQTLASAPGAKEDG